MWDDLYSFWDEVDDEASQKLVGSRTTCCPVCTTAVFPEVNALFIHMLESHHTPQQRAGGTCARQSAHPCTALLCIRRSAVEAIEAARVAEAKDAAEAQQRRLNVSRRDAAAEAQDIVEAPSNKKRRRDEVKAHHTHTSDT